MTWRRFATLLGGLSPASMLVRVENAKPKEREISDPQAAEAYFAAIG